MLSDTTAIQFNGVWKKYSKNAIFHNSLREDISSLFVPGQRQNLTANEFWALKDITMTVRKGQVVGLWGNNGAGKTTMLKLISNITLPTMGHLDVYGKVAPIIDVGSGFHPDLTGRENVYMYGVILGMSFKDVKANMESIIDFAELRPFMHMPVKKYSSGMYLRLAFSIAIHSQADIFIIDEVLMLADPVFQQKCFDKIRMLKNRNRAVVLVTQNQQVMRDISDHIYTFNAGQITNQ